METTAAARIEALREMTVAELRAEHARLFNEETRSHHKDQLWRKIAWRLQALEEGGLSERARRRAAELADDADVRVRAPRDALGGPAPADRTRTHSVRFGPAARLPMAGTVLTREYRGREVRVTVLDNGSEWGGRVYRSLTAVAAAVTGSHWNGFHFFGLGGGGGGR